MKYRRLGRTGFAVSDISHGLWGMSGWSGSDDRESLEALQLSIDLGCNFFDTAWGYGDGKSDGLLGEIMSRNKDKRIYAASKIPPKNLMWPAKPEYKYRDVFPADHVFKYAKLIREKLRTDAIDLLQFHVWDDTWAAEPRVSRDGRKTQERWLDHVFWPLVSIAGSLKNRYRRAAEPGSVDTVQVIYNIFDQAPEDKLFPVCKELNIGVLARVPLDEGSLGGKLTLDTKFPPDDWRALYFGPENLPQTVARVEKLKPLVPRE